MMSENVDVIFSFLKVLMKKNQNEWIFPPPPIIFTPPLQKKNQMGNL